MQITPISPHPLLIERRNCHQRETVNGRKPDVTEALANNEHVWRGPQVGRPEKKIAKIALIIITTYL